jgi:hypothetical protein
MIDKREKKNFSYEASRREKRRKKTQEDMWEREYMFIFNHKRHRLFHRFTDM